jgi:hypothetical protein
MHGHSHHDHSHTHEATRPEVARAQPVVLELGEGVGALIVFTDPDMLGTEVEISPAADDSARSHKDVLERLTGTGSAHTLVYDSLPEGEYTLWINNVEQARGVPVAGGAVAELDWRRGSKVT